MMLNDNSTLRLPQPGFPEAFMSMLGGYHLAWTTRGRQIHEPVDLSHIMCP